MEIEIENYNSEIGIVNQRIKGFLWKGKYWKKNNWFKQSDSRKKFLEQKKRSRKNHKEEKKLWFFN